MQFSGASTVPLVWQPLTLENGLLSLGAPFATTVECAMLGSVLVFRGAIAIPGGAATGFLVATLPSTFPAPAFTRRVMCQTGTSTIVGVNIWPDRTLKLAGSATDWLILDYVSVVLP